MLNVSSKLVLMLWEFGVPPYCNPISDPLHSHWGIGWTFSYTTHKFGNYTRHLTTRQTKQAMSPAKNLTESVFLLLAHS